MIRVILLGAMGISLLAPTSGSAQTRVGARGYVTFGPTMFAAADTFKTLGGPGSKTGVGGGGRISGLWQQLFVDVGISQQRLQGERVFMNGLTAFKLGIPLTITMRPIDVAVGWRVPVGRVSPYIAGGLTYVSYKEVADFAQPGDDVSQSESGALVTGGVDVALRRWIHVGGELRFRRVTGILGAAGVSKNVGDNNVGGLSIALRVSVGT